MHEAARKEFENTLEAAEAFTGDLSTDFVMKAFDRIIGGRIQAQAVTYRALEDENQRAHAISFMQLRKENQQVQEINARLKKENEKLREQQAEDRRI